MTRSRAAAWIAAGGLLAAWLAAAAGAPSSPAPAEPRAVRASSGDAFVGGDLQIQADKLRGQLRATPLLRASSRNPFKFAERRPVPAPRPPALSAVAPAAPVPRRPPLALVGIAENDSAGETVRTAVISGEGQLFLVKEGEAFANRYRVVRIGADAVELRDEVADATIQLGLH